MAADAAMAAALFLVQRFQTHSPQEARVSHARNPIFFKRGGTQHATTASGERSTLAIIVVYARPRPDAHPRSGHLFPSLGRVLASKSSREGGHALASRRSAARRRRIAALSSTGETLASCVGARVGGRVCSCRCRGIGCCVVDSIVEVCHGCPWSFLCRLAHRLCLLFGRFAQFGQQVHVSHCEDYWADPRCTGKV